MREVLGTAWLSVRGGHVWSNTSQASTAFMVHPPLSWLANRRHIALWPASTAPWCAAHKDMLSARIAATFSAWADLAVVDDVSLQKPRCGLWTLVDAIFLLQGRLGALRVLAELVACPVWGLSCCRIGRTQGKLTGIRITITNINVSGNVIYKEVGIKKGNENKKGT